MPDQPRTPGPAVSAEPSPPGVPPSATGTGLSSSPDPGDSRPLGLEEVGLALKQLQWRHHREANRRLASVDLSLVQWDVLRHLAKQPDASLHALAELTFQTDQSMGALAKRMIDRGLIERVDGPGRPARHQLTPAGQHARDAGGRVMA
ncbi:MAG TPA: MarR family winged helix-turn-helix transcriptional regulator, partial [Streptosporangiaceae bacterium]